MSKHQKGRYSTKILFAAIRNCSRATSERDRGAGTGIPFIKMGRLVRYKKRDVYRKEWTMLEEKELVPQACDELVEATWIRLEWTSRDVGRPRLPSYVFNPTLKIEHETEENFF